MLQQKRRERADRHVWRAGATVRPRQGIDFNSEFFGERIRTAT